jgi:hypothetical protein
MRLKNYTNIPSEKIREMKRFVKLKYSGVSKLNNITVLNCNYGYSGFFRGTPIYRMQEQRVFHMKPDEDELVVTVDPVIEKMEHTCIEVNISRNENDRFLLVSGFCYCCYKGQRIAEVDFTKLSNIA